MNRRLEYESFDAFFPQLRSLVVVDAMIPLHNLYQPQSAADPVRATDSVPSRDAAARLRHLTIQLM